MSRAPGGTSRINAAQRALAHPVRAQVYAELKKQPASPSQLGAILGESVGAISYHVRVLAEAGLATLVETVPKRGSLQHFYGALDHGGVGVTLTLPLERATQLQSDVRALVDAAHAEASSSDGDDAQVVVVVHMSESAD